VSRDNIGFVAATCIANSQHKAQDSKTLCSR
jgi:hypothetical protein